MRRLQRGVRTYAAFFLWEPPKGRAYELVLKELRHQMKLLMGVLLRESRAFDIDERFANKKPPGGWPDDDAGAGEAGIGRRRRRGSTKLRLG